MITNDFLIEVCKEDKSLLTLVASDLGDDALCKLIKEQFDFIIETDTMFIKYISNPSEKVCMVAVEESASAIQYIKNPSEQVIRLATSRDLYSMQFIENLPDDIIEEAIRINPNNLKYIQNPSEELCLRCIRKNGTIVYNMNKPTKKMLMLAACDDRVVEMYWQWSSLYNKLCHYHLELKRGVKKYND